MLSWLEITTVTLSSSESHLRNFGSLDLVLSAQIFCHVSLSLVCIALCLLKPGNFVSSDCLFSSICPQGHSVPFTGITHRVTSHGFCSEPPSSWQRGLGMATEVIIPHDSQSLLSRFTLRDGLPCPCEAIRIPCQNAASIPQRCLHFLGA